MAFLTQRSLVCPMAALLLWAAGGRAHADGLVPDEYQVKAAFLFNFAKFVEWPADAFTGPDDPLTICIWGNNPFDGALETNIREKTVANRTFVTRDVANAAQAGKCQIVFVSLSERKRVRLFLDAIKGRPILTVGEGEDFMASGGIINFKLDDSRVRIEIDLAAAERARLRISSKLLNLATVRKH